MSASIAMLKAEARLLSREPAGMFWVLGFPTLLLVLIGLVPSFRAEGSAPGGARTIDLYVPVTVLLGMIMAGLQSLPPTLAGYREKGILRRMSTTPVRPTSLLAAQMILHGAAMPVSGIAVILVGRVVYGVPLPDNLPSYAVTLALVTLGALGAGALIAALSPTAKGSTTTATVLFFPVAFTAGVYVPVQSMPQALRQVVELTPFGAASQALARASSGGWPEVKQLAVMLVWTVVLAGIAARRFRWQ
ncbi:ABC transporter permease [Actinomadura roseirufa]|uniref:ABC transporter permease n=1 Tax=Actinomadura roseirufa TaxID=2094049 RepID=UPI00104117D4|nr:ABC transporter permease [Actinomadura roseirufa]